MWWNGEQYLARVRAEMSQRIERACVLVESYAKQLVSIPVEYGDIQVSFIAKGKPISFVAFGVTRRSLPGESPRLETGELQAEITHEMTSELLGRVIAPSMKALWLELGTRYMAPRPFLRRALLDHLDEVIAILTGQDTQAGALAA